MTLYIYIYIIKSHALLNLNMLLLVYIRLLQCIAYMRKLTTYIYMSYPLVNSISSHVYIPPMNPYTPETNRVEGVYGLMGRICIPYLVLQMPSYCVFCP